MSAKSFLVAALSGAALAYPFEGLFQRQSCSAQWEQCGGTGWDGPTCCDSGSTCVAQSDYYSQCVPGTGSTTTTAAPTTTSSSAGPTTTTALPTTTSAPLTTTSVSTTISTGPTTTGSGGSASGNPFVGVNMWANNYYASEVSANAVPSLGAGAAAVAEVPSFMWLDTADKVPMMETTMSDIKAANGNSSTENAGLFVVYDLPDRDCSAAASNGEYSIADGGVEKYKAYIDSIVAVLTEYSDVKVILVVEPDSLANLVTNLSVAKCANAQSAYLECINYAITQLNLPNVAMYLDAGHAGWLGWPANLPPAATLYGQVYTNASSPASLRGLATNVANYNAWQIDSCPSYTQGNAVCDESSYINEFAPLLQAEGWDAHFITDTGRNGMQPTGQLQWGDWCNAIGTGFGLRPSSDTGSDLLDAFVWVKPGGECDGTSNTTSPRYDFHCGQADALTPAPESGTWFEAYFEQLYNNANPPFA
ncbi:carbohydrate-binding module family 1 [Xylaria sp. CBS 124048]|nr:carbohydrate-binding module family 1 [Xylaria sp. CBS 124048]